MADEIITVPTYEQIIKLLSRLATNYSNMASVFYKVFYDTVPQDVTFQMFNKEGELIDVTIPNRAKDLENLLSGEGDPEGAIEASVGVLYQDLLSGNLFIKETDSGNEGWNQFATKTFLENLFIQGNGTPEGVVSAQKGILYIDTNNASLYIHTEDNGNTGWEMISATSGNFANIDLSNLSDEGYSIIANPDLSNLTLLGETHFANPNLSNLSEIGRNLIDGKESLSNKVTSISSSSNNTEYPSARAVYILLDEKQDKLVSGTNIKTVNGTSLLGNGNLSVFPSQSGQSGKVLVTDGSNVSWQTLSGIPTGCILWFSGTSIPSGFLRCDGSSLSISSYNALYLIIGNKYGGSGSTFSLPDIRNRFIEGGTTAGSYINAGLPDIIFKMGGVEYLSSQADYWSAQWSKSVQNCTSGTSKDTDDDCMEFKQSRAANSIYGKSSTVQPPAIVLIPIIKY